MRFLILSLIVVSASIAWGKNTKYRKTQRVNFDGTSIDGTVRSPDGSYLLQKRGVKFMPLYKVNKKVDKHIKSSVEYLR